LSFLHPEFLYFMLVPLFIFFGLLLTKKESQMHFFSEEVIAKLRVGSSGLSMKVRNILFLFIGFFMIVALAEPVINNGVIKVQAKSADIMIAFDISDSMLARDVYPNRLELAKQKAIELLKLAPNERIGVVAFAKNSYLVSPMSFDHGAVNFLLHQLDTTNITEKGTNFLSMLEVVDKSIKNDKKYLLIISDGGDKDSFKDEIAFAKEKNITIFVLGVGTKKGSPIKKKDGSFIKYKGEIIISKLNDNISELATATGGVYIQNVKSDKDIKTMLKEMESKSKKKELKSEEVHRYIALFYYPLGLALFLLLIATSSFRKSSNASVLAVILFLFVVPHAKAGAFDFMKLDDAKKAYNSGEYEKSAKLYEEYAKKSGNSKAYYDEGNAFYKLKQYNKAIKSYKSAKFQDKVLKAKKLANIGNAYAKQLKQKDLKQAIKSYEESLKLKEDKDVRENLQEVKKLLKKQQQKSKNNKNNKKKKDKNKENQNKENQNKDGKSKKSNNKDNKNKDAKSKKSKKKDNKNKDSKSKKSSKKDDKNKKENKSSKSDNNKKDKKSDKNSKKSQGDKKKKQDLKKLDKNLQNQKLSCSKEKMSEKEEAKWLKQLNLQKNTYLYRLNNQKPKEENNDEKPW